MKLIGGLLLALSGLGWGLGRAWELRRRVELLTELLGLCGQLKAEVLYSARPIGELLSMSGCRLCRMAESLPEFAMDPAGALAEACRRAFTREPDRELTEAFARGLGSSDTQGTLEHLELHSALIEARLQEARQELAQKNRLYPALGLSAALAVVVMAL